ncbi:restriction endonuclease subunit S [Nitrosomonas sp. ANs5]|uniref:restriction endonuclease subunit S n=1 Tax=Nitrosomonas sp. ANs5 TaxID=3423941 RepID=UPI003D34C48D
MNDHQVAEVSAEYLAEAADKVVPAGYKQTEVGVIPEGWHIKKIGDVADVIRGASPRPKDDKRYYNGNIPRLMVEDVTRDGKYVTPIVDSLTVAGAKLSRRCPKGTLTLVCSGTVGIPSILAVDACIHDGFLGLIKVSKTVSIEYLYHFLTTQREKFNNSATHGGVFTNLTTEGVKEFLIALPASYEEQTAIANALSDVDALISELEKLIAKKQAIKTATMQQLLTGRTRLPQFALREDGSKKGYKQSELGEIPEDWEIAPFVSLLSIRHGKNQKSVEVENGEYPILATGGQIGWANSYLWDKPSVLIGRKGTIDKPRYADKPFWTVDTLFYSEIKPWVDAKFVYYKFCMIDWMQYNEASGVPSLNASIIEGIRSVIPKKEEQTAIATILSDMDEEIQALEQRLAKTRQIKQGMMQELLTGKTRLAKPSNEERESG